MIVFAIVDDSLPPDSQLGDSVEIFMVREDAERFVEQVRGDDPEAASSLRIEERELGQLADEINVDDPVAGRAIEIVGEVLERFDRSSAQTENGRT